LTNNDSNVILCVSQSWAVAAYVGKTKFATAFCGCGFGFLDFILDYWAVEQYDDL